MFADTPQPVSPCSSRDLRTSYEDGDRVHMDIIAAEPGIQTQWETLLQKQMAMDVAQLVEFA